jgi:hypothetical protein
VDAFGTSDGFLRESGIIRLFTVQGSGITSRAASYWAASPAPHRPVVEISGVRYDFATRPAHRRSLPANDY